MNYTDATNLSLKGYTIKRPHWDHFWMITKGNHLVAIADDYTSGGQVGVSPTKEDCAANDWVCLEGATPEDVMMSSSSDIEERIKKLEGLLETLITKLDK